MYHSIFVPLDGSHFAEAALPVATDIACATGAQLHMAHVHVVPIAYDPDGLAVVDAEVDHANRQRERAYLDGLQRDLPRGARRTSRVTMLDGEIVEALAEDIAASKADLAVMTTHGRGGLSRLWLGSVANGLLHHVDIPVLLLHPREGAAGSMPAGTFRKILVPLDGSALAEQIVEPVLELGSRAETEYILFQVVRPLIFPGSAYFSFPAVIDSAATQECLRNAHEYLELVAERLRRRGIDVRTRVALDERAAAAILDEAALQSVDLIAMATHGRGGLGRLMWGSVADNVLRGATCPVLLDRPAAVRLGSKLRTKSAVPVQA